MIKRSLKTFFQLAKPNSRFLYQFCQNKIKIDSVLQNNAASYTISQNIPGAKEGKDGIYALMFTCGPCGNKMARTFTKNAYHNGVVIIRQQAHFQNVPLRCDQCQNNHLIADNLGWFEDDKWNVEKHAEGQGKPLPKVKNEEINEIINQFILNDHKQ